MSISAIFRVIADIEAAEVSVVAAMAERIQAAVTKDVRLGEEVESGRDWKSGQPLSLFVLTRVHVSVAADRLGLSCYLLDHDEFALLEP